MSLQEFLADARWEMEQNEIRIARGEDLPHLALHAFLFRDIVLFAAFVGMFKCIEAWHLVTTGERLGE